MIYIIPNWLRKYLGKEDLFTVQAANYLRSKSLLFHHTFNEGKRSKTMQAKLKGFGVMTGIPDFLIFDPNNKYIGLAIELKVIYDNNVKNRLSKNQIKAQDDLINKGWKCVTVWDIDSFINEIEIFRKD